MKLSCLEIPLSRTIALSKYMVALLKFNPWMKGDDKRQKKLEDTPAVMGSDTQQ